MPDFQFEARNSFSENWETFLSSLDSIDGEMAEILRANEAALASIVQEGKRDTRARNQFNKNIIEALNALAVPNPPRDEE